MGHGLWSRRQASLQKANVAVGLPRKNSKKEEGIAKELSSIRAPHAEPEQLSAVPASSAKPEPIREHVPPVIQARIHETGTFFSVISVLAVPFVFVLQSNGITLGWQLSAAIYILGIAGFICEYSKWDSTHSWNTWIRQAVRAVAVAILLAVSLQGTLTQYHKEHLMAFPGPFGQIGTLRSRSDYTGKAVAVQIGFGGKGWPLVVGGPSGGTGTLFTEHDRPLLGVVINDQRLLVSAQFRDATGKLLAQIQDNHWVLNPASVFQFNYTNEFLEVIDQNGDVALQLMLLDGTVMVEGTLRCHGGKGLYLGHTKDGLGFIATLGPNQSPSDVVQEGFPKSMCKYPFLDFPNDCPRIDDVRKMVAKFPISKTGYFIGTPIDVCNGAFSPGVKLVFDKPGGA